MAPINKRIWLVLILSLIWTFSPSDASAQGVVSKYLVLLKDKANSPYSTTQPGAFLSARAIQRRAKQGIAVTERDLPPNPGYIAQIQQTGATVWYRSRWANAALVLADGPTIQKIRALPFVAGLEQGRSLADALPTNPPRPDAIGQVRVTTPTPAYGNSRGQIVQIGADSMHLAGFHGEGMLLAVLDDGFLGANTAAFLANLFADRRVLTTYNFVQHQPGSYNIGGGHGTAVLSTMAATADNQLVGTAYNASFVLLCTEDVNAEKPIEEANWLFGAEFADSTGADILTSSLGYNTFDAPFSSHTYADLDGKTTLITRAAQWASEAGMVVLVAAGNDGSNAWRYISAPADAPGVLAIGAVNNAGIRASFSSFGLSADGRIKPDLSAWGVSTVVGGPKGNVTTGNGTSFATPLVAGLAAGFWQANPNLTAVEVTNLLRQSGSQASTPDNSLGYGIPNFGRAMPLSANLLALGAVLVAPNPFTDQIRLLNLPAGVPVELLLTDLSGRIIRQQTLLGGEHVVVPATTGSFPVGLYLLQIQTDKNRKVFKLLKE